MTSLAPSTQSDRLVRVAGLTARHVRVSLRTTIRHASHSRSDTDNVVVECRLSDGTVGYGEGLPRDYVTGETIDDSIRLLTEVDWQAAAPSAEGFTQAVEAIRELRMPATPGDDRECVGNAARCAAELALLDAFGRRFGKSLSDVVAMPRYAAIHSPRAGCRYSGAITTAKPRKELFSALKMWLFGFQQVKIKVGAAGQDDVARLKKFRRLLGRKRDLRIDANEAWSPDEAALRIRELESFGVTAVEQPVRHEDVACLAEVRRRTSTPIMLDESLCSRVDAERAIAGGLCDVFNIRLSKCGGFLPSLELALLARQAGLSCQLGCQVGETGILSAAGRHFACSVGGLRYLEGSYDRFLVHQSMTRENLTFGYGGRAPALKGAGLGATIDAGQLERATVRKVHLWGDAP